MAETVVFSEPYVWEFLGQIGIVFVAMLAGMVIFTGLNYLGQRFFAFRGSQNGKS